MAPNRVKQFFQHASGGTDASDAQVTWYIEQKWVEPNVTDKLGCNALHYAVSKNRCDLVGWLIDHGVDPLHTNLRGRTPLHTAADKGRHHIIEVLVEKGAHSCLHQCDSDGNNPLHIAVINCELQSLRQLILCGADPNIPNTHGKTSMELAGSGARNLQVLGVVKKMLDNHRNGLVDGSADSVTSHSSSTPRLRPDPTLMPPPEVARSHSGELPHVSDPTSAMPFDPENKPEHLLLALTLARKLPPVVATCPGLYLEAAPQLPARIDAVEPLLRSVANALELGELPAGTESQIVFLSTVLVEVWHTVEKASETTPRQSRKLFRRATAAPATKLTGELARLDERLRVVLEKIIMEMSQPLRTARSEMQHRTPAGHGHRPTPVTSPTPSIPETPQGSEPSADGSAQPPMPALATPVPPPGFASIPSARGQLGGLQQPAIPPSLGDPSLNSVSSFHSTLSHTSSLSSGTSTINGTLPGLNDSASHANGVQDTPAHPSGYPRLSRSVSQGSLPQPSPPSHTLYEEDESDEDFLAALADPSYSFSGGNSGNAPPPTPPRTTVRRPASSGGAASAATAPRAKHRHSHSSSAAAGPPVMPPGAGPPVMPPGANLWYSLGSSAGAAASTAPTRTKTRTRSSLSSGSSGSGNAPTPLNTRMLDHFGAAGDQPTTPPGTNASLSSGGSSGQAATPTHTKPTLSLNSRGSTEAGGPLQTHPSLSSDGSAAADPAPAPAPIIDPPHIASHLQATINTTYHAAPLRGPYPAPTSAPPPTLAPFFNPHAGPTPPPGITPTASPTLTYPTAPRPTSSNASGSSTLTTPNPTPTATAASIHTTTHTTPSQATVGLDTTLSYINQKLQGPGSCGVLLIHGPVGVGKSTVLRAMFDQAALDMKGAPSHWVAKLGGPLGGGLSTAQLLKIQAEMMRGLGGEEVGVRSLAQGREVLREMLRGQRVLLAIDEATSSILQDLLPPDLPPILHPSSLILLASRDPNAANFLQTPPRTVLLKHPLHPLPAPEATLLFSLRAFGTPTPPFEHAAMVAEVVRVAGGLPLALEEMANAWRATHQPPPLFGADPETLAQNPGGSQVGDKLFMALFACFMLLSREQADALLDIAVCFNGAPVDAVEAYCGADTLATLERVALVQRGPRAGAVEGEDGDASMDRSGVWVSSVVVAFFQLVRLVQPGEVCRYVERDEDFEMLLEEGSRGTWVAGVDVDLPRDAAVKVFDRQVLMLHDCGVSGKLHSTFPNLRWLSWSLQDAGPAALPAPTSLVDLTSLQVLRLENMPFSTINLQSLPKLRHLSLSAMPHLVAVAGLQQVSHLTSISLSACPVLGHIPTAPPLRRLVVRHSCTRALNAASLNSLQNLEEVEVEGGWESPYLFFENCQSLRRVVARCLSAIKVLAVLNCPVVQELSVAACPGVKRMMGLEELHQLQVLHLRQLFSLEGTLDLAAYEDLYDLTIDQAGTLRIGEPMAEPGSGITVE